VTDDATLAGGKNAVADLSVAPLDDPSPAMMAFRA